MIRATETCQSEIALQEFPPILERKGSALSLSLPLVITPKEALERTKLFKMTLQGSGTPWREKLLMHWALKIMMDSLLLIEILKAE